MRLAWALLAFCSLVLSTTVDLSPDFCSQTFNSDLKPGFPKTIKTNDPGVLKAARHSVERFNNCTNDIFLFKESHVIRALVQGYYTTIQKEVPRYGKLALDKIYTSMEIVKGLKYMLDMEISRTTCKKTKQPSLDNCDFQTNHTLKLTLCCYSEVWVIPWLQKFKVPILHCH